MTCADAHPWLTLRQPLPLEAGASLTADLTAHVHACPKCGALASREIGVDAALGKLIRDVPIPIGLKTRLIVQTENARRARDRQRLFRVAAPLAASLLVVILVWNYRAGDSRNAPVQLRNLETWVNTSSERIGERRIPVTIQGLPLPLPEEIRNGWDMRYLRTSYQTNYQGRWVTVLEFQRDQSQAVVVLLPPDLVDPQQFPQYPGRYEDDPRVLGQLAKQEYIAFVVIRSGQYRDFRKPVALPTGA